MLNKKHSFKDYTDQDLSSLPAEEFNNSIIRGTCFAQQVQGSNKKGNKRIFPKRIHGVIFERCNLDNVHVPKSCTVKSCCSCSKIRVQNDGELWKLDDNDKPLEPMNLKGFVEHSISTNPADIPKVKKKIPIIQEKEEKILKDKIKNTRRIRPNLTGTR